VVAAGDEAAVGADELCCKLVLVIEDGTVQLVIEYGTVHSRRCTVHPLPALPPRFMHVRCRTPSARAASIYSRIFGP
jgi:hypothetical protein